MLFTAIIAYNVAKVGEKLRMGISIGDKVPSFTAISNKGTINLNDYIGKYVVLYFYPKDNTPGCTVEANDFKTLYPKFKAKNAEIIGVSRDSLTSHDKFECKYELPFPLLADTDSKICDLFEVINTKSIFGKTALGLVRSTFLIGPDGCLIRTWRQVKVANHAQEVLDMLN